MEAMITRLNWRRGGSSGTARMRLSLPCRNVVRIRVHGAGMRGVPDGRDGASGRGVLTGPGERLADQVAGRDAGRPASRPARRLRRPGWQWGLAMQQARRALWLGMAVLIGGYAAFAILLLATPSVATARQLARAQDKAHHAVYPGPPVPARFAAALEATEDHRFNTEPGIDPIAIGRFVLGEITGQGDTGGATLYQQLAKMLYTNGQPSLGMEADQVALGIKLRLKYGPAEVLRLYAAVVYFGHQFYGLKAASCGYFGVPPAKMSWPQAALLAGLV